LRLALLLGAQPLDLPAGGFKDAPAVHLGIEHFQGSAAGVDLVVMGEIGEAFEKRGAAPRSTRRSANLLTNRGAANMAEVAKRKGRRV
jgi:hypothetical protein